jgi:hypothetical protein
MVLVVQINNKFMNVILIVFGMVVLYVLYLYIIDDDSNPPKFNT